MRRMYSKQQLEEIAKYLVEHSELNFLEDIAFTGDVSVGGDLSVTGDASVGGDLPVVGTITGGEIIENMTGYSASLIIGDAPITIESYYMGVVKNGNKLTIVLSGSYTITDTIDSALKDIVELTIPESIGQKLYPAYGSTTLTRVDLLAVGLGTSNGQVSSSIYKITNSKLKLLLGLLNGLTANQRYYIRMEATFLLSDNMLPNP